MYLGRSEGYICGEVIASTSAYIYSRLLNSLTVVEEANSHILRSADRRIAPAVTMLYKRASQDVAQPMRLSALNLLPLPPALSRPFTQQNTITTDCTSLESSFIYKLEKTHRHTADNH